MSQENMRVAFLIGVLAVPFVAGFHRYAASRGYRNLSPHTAWGEAWRVGAMVLLCEVIVMAIGAVLMWAGSEP